MRPEREKRGSWESEERAREKEERGWVPVSSDLYRPWTGQRQVQTGPAWYRRTRRVSSGRENALDPFRRDGPVDADQRRCT